MKRVLSLWLPRFSTDRIARTRPAWRSRPFVTTFAERGRLIVAAANGAAEESGIGPGLPLADAQALLPSLASLPADPKADAEALAALAEWCQRYTPSVGISGSDGLFLDITGCAHLMGGEEALGADLLDRLEGFGFTARAAAAHTPGAAWAFAHFALGTERFASVLCSAHIAAAKNSLCAQQNSLCAAKPRIPSLFPLPDGEDVVRGLLAPLPVAALRISPAHEAELKRLGLKRIGDLYAIPRAGLVRRFGDALALRLDQAVGHVAEPISPRCPSDPDLLRHAFAEPVRERAVIGAVFDRLLAGLCERLERKGLGIRRLDFTLYRTDGTRAAAEARTSRPALDTKHLARLFQDKLDRLDPGLGVDLATLSAPLSEPFCLRQTSGLAPAASRPAQHAVDELAPLVDRLDNRLGPGTARRLVAAESHIPERAVLRRPPFSAGPRARAPSAPPNNQPPRPVRLFNPPEPIEAMAPVPDHPPVLFRWRTHLHRVKSAEGPERIAPEWWNPNDWPRATPLRDAKEGAANAAPGLRDADIDAANAAPGRIAPEWWNPKDRPDAISLRDGEEGAANAAATPSRDADIGAANAAPGRTRDYYRVEDEDGRRFWLFRRGLYQPGARPDWFLHGLFP
ncbi:MAG: DNA polymerase Y family protein [Alphaproteobacteria bacterium]